VHGKNQKAQTASEKSGPAEVALLRVDPERDTVELGKKFMQRRRGLGHGVDTMVERKIKHRLPFDFRQMSKGFNDGFGQRIRTPQQTDILVGARSMLATRIL
jgi:hypothetical protein